MQEEINGKTEKTADDKKADSPSLGKKVGKKALGAAAAVTTGTAVLVNGLFGSPDEILKADNALSNPAVIHVIDEDAADDEDETEEEDEEEESGPATFWGRMRSWVWSWPLPLRIFLAVPLWVMGWGVCQAGHAVWSLFLSPVLQALSGVILLFVILAGVMALAGRALFPELPLREVFKKSRLIALALGSAAIEAFIALLPYIWDEMEPYSALIRLGLGALLLGGILFSMWVTKERRKRYVLRNA